MAKNIAQIVEERFKLTPGDAGYAEAAIKIGRDPNYGISKPKISVSKTIIKPKKKIKQSGLSSSEKLLEEAMKYQNQKKKTYGGGLKNAFGTMKSAF